MARLRDYRVWPLRVPLVASIDMSFGRLGTRPCLLLQLEDSDGCTGFGEAWVNFPSWSLVERAVTLDRVVQRFVGRTLPPDPQAWIDEVEAGLSIQALQSGTTIPLRHAVSALDIALWDLAARQRSRSLASLLAGGAPRDRVAVYASGLGPRDVAAETTAAVAAGHVAVKLRVGFGRDIDRANLAAARDAAGWDRAIMVDANQAFGPKTFRDIEGDFVRAAVAWVEEPLRADDREGYRQLGSRRVRTRLAGGENWYGADLSAAIEEGWVQVIQPDVTKAGGISAVRTAIRLAARAGRTVALHVFGSPVGWLASVALAAAEPGVSWVEMEAQGAAVWGCGFPQGCFDVVQGTVAPPVGPGLGARPQPRLADLLARELRAVVRLPEAGARAEAMEIGQG